MKPASVIVLPLLLAAAMAAAQEPAAELEPRVDTSSPEQLEPGVDTSAPPRDAEQPQAEPSLEPENTATPTTPATSASSPPVRGGGGRAMDRIELEATEITGNRELPKVLYIVPWRQPDLGDLLARPANSLLDEVLEPVDRDVFRRRNRYYEALRPDETRVSSPSDAGAEK